MNDFPDIICDNLPGLINFDFIPFGDVLSISDPVGMLIVVTLKPAKVWLKGYSIDKLDYSEDFEDTNHGRMYYPKLSGFIQGDSKELLAYLEEVKQYRHIVKTKDANGMFRIIGSMHAPARFDYKIAKDEENNGYNFTFAAKHRDLPPFFVES